MLYTVAVILIVLWLLGVGFVVHHGRVYPHTACYCSYCYYFASH